MHDIRIYVQTRSCPKIRWASLITHKYRLTKCSVLRAAFSWCYLAKILRPGIRFWSASRLMKHNQTRRGNTNQMPNSRQMLSNQSPIPPKPMSVEKCTGVSNNIQCRDHIWVQLADILLRTSLIIGSSYNQCTCSTTCLCIQSIQSTIKNIASLRAINL